MATGESVNFENEGPIAIPSDWHQEEILVTVTGISESCPAVQFEWQFTPIPNAGQAPDVIIDLGNNNFSSNDSKEIEE